MPRTRHRPGLPRNAGTREHGATNGVDVQAIVCADVSRQRVHLEDLGLVPVHPAQSPAIPPPMLPGAEGLAEALVGKIDRLLLDRMNYHHADAIYRKNGLMEFLGPEYYYETGNNILSVCQEAGIEC